MSEPRQVQLPWQGLLALAAAVAGAVYYLAPLDTSRPVERSGVSLKLSRAQDVDARLWQDPLATAYAHEEQVRATEAKKGAPAGSEEKGRHEARELCSQVQKARADNDLLVMPVLLSGGTYAEYAEGRLRARRAVLEALGTNGLSPAEGEHIGYVRVPPLPTSGEQLGSACDPSPAGAAETFVLPYEWCAPAFNRVTDRPRRVLLLWIREEDLTSRPLQSLDTLLRYLAPDLDHRQVRVIGPRTSTMLKAIVDEVSAPDFKPVLNGAAVFSPTATMSDELLMRDRATPEIRTVKQLLQRKAAGLAFHRVTLTDDVVSRALVLELGRRGVRLGLRKPRDLPNDYKGGADHVALISEWDTFYGRALPLTFAREVTGTDFAELEQRYPHHLHAYHYLRGIDGMLPGTPAQEQGKPGGAPQAGVARERTEGLNQADYLRRLAQQLQSLDRELIRQGSGGLKAVGVLGSDVYDKLLVLKALRGALPGALFFTNNLDARFGHPDEWRCARNLIIASPFGLSLAPHWSDERRPFTLQGKVLPFRDAYQTATYAATLFASDGATATVLDGDHTPFGTARLFEIAQSGPYALPGPIRSADHHFDVHPDRTVRWWNTSRWRWLIGLAICIAALIGWILLVVRARPTNAGDDPATQCARGASVPAVDAPDRAPRSLRERLCGLPSWLAFAVAALIAWPTVAFIAHRQRAYGEPFLWTEGISIWPTETLRLIAALMAGWFLFKTDRALRDNEATIHREFDLLPPEGRPHWPCAPLFSRLWWRQILGLLSLRRWLVAIDGRIVAQELWRHYVRAGRWSVRALRVLPLAALYMVGGVCVIAILGFPPVPARGVAACRWDLFFLALAVFSSVYLTFYVADATMLNRRLIKYLVIDKTTWPEKAYQRLRNRWTIFPGAQESSSPSQSAPSDAPNAPAASPPSAPAAAVEGAASSKERPPNRILDEYLDIDLIATRTATVGELIYYPFVVITLLIISRIGIFDHWTWPAGLLIVMCGNGGFAAWSAWKLRSSAEDARQSALGKLNDILIARTAEGLGQQAEAQTARETIAMIRAENRGAFKSVSRHPLIGALLLPSGGAGIWALSQYLPQLL